MAMAGPNYGSLIGIDGEVRFKNPQFYVHQEYSREAGNVLVDLDAETQGAVFSSEAIHELSGQTNVAMLDAMATRTPGSTDTPSTSSTGVSRPWSGPACRSTFLRG